jgi:hypothetical protein
MSEFSHAHPMPEGRRFEHTHNVRPALLEEHAAKPLAEAHPGMRAVAEAPETGTPPWLRQLAESKRDRAAWHREQAEQLEREADELEHGADRDEQEPPSEQERIRRLLDGGLG